jgi:cell wall-associated NlpC family hydrolase
VTLAKLTAVALALLVGAVGALAILVPLTGHDSNRMPLCATTGPIDGLSAIQAQNARTVVAVATARGGRRAALVGIAVVLAESDLRSLGNPSVVEARLVPDQGTGTDHDSVGLFQQRAGWGSAAARMDPVTSTNAFLDSLLAVEDWGTLPPWVAAQRVQRSAFDGHPTAANHGSAVYGGNYLARLPRAQHILDTITAASSTDLCGGLDSASNVLAATGTGHGLPADYAVPPTSSIAARTAVSYALAQRGKPYLWGGTGPDRFDCSGLTQSAWAVAGHRLGRTTWDQMRDGTTTTIASLQPGDLVLIPGSAGSLASPAHMGMYIGDGLVVHAPKTGDVVKVTPLSSFTSGGISALRHIA